MVSTSVAAALLLTWGAQHAHGQPAKDGYNPHPVRPALWEIAGRPPDPVPSRADRLARQLKRERAEHRAVVRRVRVLERVVQHKPDVQEALTIASVVYGVPRADLSTVAFCESGHDPGARNGQYVGIFQWGPSWNSTVYASAGLSPWSPYAAALAAAQRVKGAGWGWWSCKPGGGR